jgi:hypothetical protein
MDVIRIETMEEYNYCESRGYTPIVDKNFDLEINLRVKVQKQIFGNFAFGKNNIPLANDLFYHWVWEHKPNFCEECIKPLRNYSSVHVSHILSKGANAEMAHDPRNTNILCFNCHSKWENGKRHQMRINSSNQQIITKLKKEYNSL